MARNRIDVEAPPEAVFAALADPCAYPRFVVGAKRLRSYDETWPAKGSAISPDLGAGPFVLHGCTEVVDVSPPECLVEHAHLGRLGVVEIRFTIEPRPSSRSHVEIEEHAVEGPLAHLWHPLFDGITWLRNHEVLRRLKREAMALAKRR